MSLSRHEAETMLGKRDSRKLKNNTYLLRRGDDIAVRLHETDILTFTPAGDTVYDCHGWRSATTTERLNDFGAPGIVIWQEKGQWFVGKRQNYGWPNKSDYKLYQDGMIVTAAGEITAITPTAATESTAATAIGSTARTSTSASSSTSLPTRPASSPPGIATATGSVPWASSR